MSNKNKTDVQMEEQQRVDDELFTVNGRVYRKNSDTQKTSPSSRQTEHNVTPNTTSHTGNDNNNDIKYGWVIYLVVYIVGVVICLAAGVGVYALVWPLMAGIVIFFAALVVSCFK